MVMAESMSTGDYVRVSQEEEVATDAAETNRPQ